MPHPLLLSLGALAGYLLLMWSSPVRTSLVDGFRVVQRYPALPLTLGLFGFGYALFRMAVRWYFAMALPPGEQPLFLWARAPYRPGATWYWGAPDSLWFLPPRACYETARAAVLPMLDSTAGLFNNLVSTFPLAALAALLLLVNWGGHQGVLWRALRKRSGRWAFPAHLGILLCAIAALAKPFLYALPLYINVPHWFLWSPMAAWLAFLFEYLFGVLVQLYLLLLAYCWVRGLTFRHGALLDFTIRRLSFVLRWAAVVMILSTLLVDLPIMLQNLPRFAAWLGADEAAIDRRSAIARTVLDLVFLSFASVQIILTLHNESLRRSLADHLRFLRRHWWALGWFILLAALHFYALHYAHLLCLQAFGEGTALWLGWELLFPWLAGALGAWLLASWVSMFKRSDADRLGDREWVRF